MSQDAIGQNGRAYFEDDEVNVLVWVDLGKWPIGLVLGPKELMDREALLQAVKENMIDMLNVVSPLDFGEHCAFQVEEDPDQAARAPDEGEMARLREMLGGHRGER